MARAPEGFYRGSTLEGVEVDTFYRTLPHTAGWSVHFGVSSEMLDAPVRRSGYLMVGGGLGRTFRRRGKRKIHRGHRSHIDE